MSHRQATPADAGAIAGLHIASWRSAYRGLLADAFLESQDLAERTAKWESMLAEPEVIVLLAEDARHLLGFACGPTRDGDADPTSAWEIYNLHVDPDRRGSGIGGRLFDAAADLGRERRARELTLWVVDQNAPARRFYERKGMQPDGASQLHQVGPGAALSEVRYRASLDTLLGLVPGEK